MADDLVWQHRRWLARVCTKDERVRGAGFAIDDSHVVTAAHVVLDAGVDGPGHRVWVDFPVLEGSGGWATVLEEGWAPQRGTRGDTAVLRLEHPPPGLVPVPLTSEKSVGGHGFSAYGFPRGYDDGVETGGRIGALVGLEWVQLEVDSGLMVEAGFSGAAVWDKTLQAVVGMVLTRDAPTAGRVAFGVPLHVLGPRTPIVRAAFHRVLDEAPTADGLRQPVAGRERVERGTRVKPDDVMQPGEILYDDSRLLSASGRYEFVYQADGNLVLYDQGCALWASCTRSEAGGRCTFQTDGNLVIYDRDGVVRWAADVGGRGGNRLAVQDDGNVVIYASDEEPVWATNTWLGTGPTASGDEMQPGEILYHDGSLTSASGRFRLIYQVDGNLVLYGQNHALWESGTQGQTDGWCTFQTDGNLVIYLRSGIVCWAADCGGSGGSRLVLQDDGNLVIYTSDDKPTWATDTVRR